MAEYLSKWLEIHVDQMLKANTRASYRTAIDKHIVPQLGQIRLKDLEPIDIKEWLLRASEMESGGRAIQAAFNVLRSALSYAVVELKILPESPCSHLAKPKHRRRDIVPFEVAEANAILKATAGSRWHAFFSLALGLGLRQGELFGLEWSAVDLRTKRIHVRKQLVEVKGSRALDTPKTVNGVRNLMLPDHCVRALIAQRGILMREGFAAGSLVFPNTIGAFQGRANFHHNVWKPLLASLGLKPRGVHHCRHTFATASLAAGDDAATVAKILGHANAAVTMAIYSHCLPSTETKAAATSDRLFG